MKKRIILFLVLILGFTTLVGCEKESENGNENKNPETEEKISAVKYNGVYKNGEFTFHILPIDEDRLEYYITNANNDRIYGRLECKDDTAIYEESDKKVKVKLKGDKIIVEAENMIDYPEGTYKYVEACTTEDFYENVYGLSKYFDSKIAGMYTNGADKIYIYQPISKYIEINARASNVIVSYESKYVEGQEFKCEIDGIKYIVKLCDNELTYTIISKEGETTYENKFTKTSRLTKSEIIEIFNPFYFFYMEDSNS